jgi:hypothetical protein
MVDTTKLIDRLLDEIPYSVFITYVSLGKPGFDAVLFSDQFVSWCRELRLIILLLSGFSISADSDNIYSVAARRFAIP